MHRQARWRPTWLLDVDTTDGPLALVVRGERGEDTPLQFPLKHEMALQQVMHEQGVAVPKVFGWIDDLPAYVMERVPGRPDFGDITREQRDIVMREYMGQLARLHRLPLEPFADAGIVRAETPAGSGTIGMARYEELYRATNDVANPYLEFMLGWLKRNPLDTRGRESAIVWDSGQLHQDTGQFVAILDVEIGHIGDPMMDLAAPRMRDTVLDFGNFTDIYRMYEDAGGFPVDIDAIQWHHIAFTLTNELAFRASLTNPSPDADYMTNVQWCSETNLHGIEALAERLGIALEAPPLPTSTPARTAVANEQLVRMLRGAETDDAFVQYKMRVAFRLARYVQRAGEVGAELDQADLDDLVPLLGHRPKSWQDGDAELEAFVLQDDGAHDEELVHLFYRRFMRHKTTIGPPGSAMAAHHTTQPFGNR